MELSIYDLFQKEKEKDEFFFRKGKKNQNRVIDGGVLFLIEDAHSKI